MRVFSPARFATARKRAGLSQTRLGEQIGVSLTGVNRIEKGHRSPSLTTLLAAADAMGATLDELMFNTEETN